MKKLILFIPVALICIVSFAQKKGSTPSTSSSKSSIAVVSIQEIIAQMPEAKSADSVLQAYQKDLENGYNDVLNELKEKDSIYRADSTNWSVTIRDLKKNDIQRLYQQLQSWQQTAEESIQRKQQELLIPIRKTAMAAIEKVARAKNYTQVVEKSIVYFYSPEDDILPLVKTELGIK